MSIVFSLTSLRKVTSDISHYPYCYTTSIVPTVGPHVSPTVIRAHEKVGDIRRQVYIIVIVIIIINIIISIISSMLSEHDAVARLLVSISDM